MSTNKLPSGPALAVSPSQKERPAPDERNEQANYAIEPAHVQPRVSGFIARCMAWLRRVRTTGRSGTP